MLKQKFSPLDKSETHQKQKFSPINQQNKTKQKIKSKPSNSKIMLKQKFSPLDKSETHQQTKVLSHQPTKQNKIMK